MDHHHAERAANVKRQLPPTNWYSFQTFRQATKMVNMDVAALVPRDMGVTEFNLGSNAKLLATLSAIGTISLARRKARHFIGNH